MLLANGSSLYVRNKATSEWLNQINFDSLIVALYPVKDDINKILCVTESSLELLVLAPNGENIEKDLSQKLPSKPIRTNLS